jgi:tetratricopeptide (TPR) repeat protein
LCFSLSAASQTSERYFESAKTKIAEADKLVWGSDKWKAKFRSALIDMNEAINLDSKKAAFYAKRAIIHEHLDDFDLALKDASTAISLAPDIPDHYALRGSLRYQIEAIRIADERKKLDDPDEAAKIVADHKAALEDYNKAISIAPKDPRWYTERGDFYDLTKQTDEALADYTRVIELDPNNTLALWKRGMIQAQRGIYQEALADYSRIIVIDPKRTVAYLARAEVYEALKQYDKAIANTTSAHKTAPRSPGPLRFRAELYRKTGKIALARKDELAATRLSARSTK